MLTVQKYGNMSAATVPVALVEALDEGRVKPGSLLLMTGFGGGLTWASLLVRWGDRVTPLGTTDRALARVYQDRARDGARDQGATGPARQVGGRD